MGPESKERVPTLCEASDLDPLAAWSTPLPRFPRPLDCAHLLTPVREVESWGIGAAVLLGQIT